MLKIIKEYKNCIKLTVSEKVYSLSAIYSAGYVFLDRVYIYLDKDPKNKICIWLFPKNKKENLNKLGMDFYNELLNYAHYFSASKANSEAIKLILQRALFSASPSMAKDAEDKYIENLINQELGDEKSSAASSKKR